MKTITLQVGNSDDKLTQKEWAEFVAAISDLLADERVTIFFFGCSHGAATWQNAAWVFSIAGEQRERFVKNAVAQIRKEYRQDSAAWTEGKTQFI